MPQATQSTVLLIEPDTSLRRLIALGLQHRGLQVIGVSSLSALADQPIANPDLLILDIDTGRRDNAELLAMVKAHSYLSTLPMVVLAWDPTQISQPSTALPLLECLAKPFDARLLQATIENLLVTSAAIALSANQAAISAPVIPPVPTASLCPLATAAGLLLTVIGLMLQPVIAGIGLLVVLIALLWWTLGQRPPERQILLGEVGAKYSTSLP